MLILNSMTKRTYRISEHALERWRERSTGDIVQSFGRAFQYGGRYGDDFFLIDEEIVFVCKSRQPYYMVTTVLTKQQAIVNMQGIRAVRELPLQIPTAEAGKSQPNVAGLTYRIGKMSTEEIMVLRDRLQGTGDGQAMFEVQTELRIRKIRAHADRVSLDNASLKRAMWKLLGEEKTMELFQLANSYREEERCKAASSQMNTAVE